MQSIGPLILQFKAILVPVTQYHVKIKAANRFPILLQHPQVGKRDYALQRVT